MSTINEILGQMADNVRTVVAMNAAGIDIQVEPEMVLNPTPPCIDMWPDSPSEDPETGAFGEMFGGERIIVRARVSTADSNAGQSLLFDLMDDETDLSIGNALMDDPLLNGMGQIDVMSRTGLDGFPIPGGEVLLGCTFGVIVLKARS